MPFEILIIIFLISFSFITYTRFNLGLFFLFLLFPTYLIKLSIGPLPTTLLELMIGIILVIWVIKFHKNIIYHLSSIIKKNKLLFISSLIFLTAATISIYTAIDIKSAAGEWKAFYIEPFLIFLILITTLTKGTGVQGHKDTTKLKMKNENKKQVSNFQFPISLSCDLIIFGLILSGLATSILAIYQHFTGWMVPWDFWQNLDTFRVTGWYGYPNGVGLFLAPLLPLALYQTKQYYKMIHKKRLEDYKIKNLSIFQSFNLPSLAYFFPLITAIIFIPASILAIFFAKSTGALIGVASGLGLLLLFYKKTRVLTILFLVFCFLFLVSLPADNLIKQELSFQDRSGQIRISMWTETLEFLSDHPIAGAGLTSYKQKIVPYHTTVNGEGIEIFPHPHNIFLIMWVNLGLLGLVGFLGILFWFFYNSLKIRRLEYLKIGNNSVFQSSNLSIFLLSSMTVIIVTG
ncbi:O-antigen ligase family protein, partial [Patescibacteria group bacterium]|nr:O-antigen ligase family protein [Patescibacteria group bacterium]